jgi:hypothetical protein
MIAIARPLAARSYLVGLAVLFVGFGLAHLAWPLRAARTTPAVWLVPSLERIGRDAPSGSDLSLELYAARGEYEAFQIAIQAPEGGLTDVTVRVADLLGADGARIAAANVTLYREHYVNVRTSSLDLRGTNRPLGAGWYADALVPMGIAEVHSQSDGPSLATRFAIAPHQNQPIWVDVFVPRTAPAGRYSAAIAVETAQGRIAGEVLLNVWDFELPLTPSLNSAFIIYHANTEQAQVELLKHRLMPQNVNVRNEARLIAEWGLKSTNIGLWSKATEKHCMMSPTPSLETARRASGGHNPALRRYNYTADEIDRCPALLEPMKAWARVLHEAGVDNLVTMTPVPELYDDGSGSGRSAVDIWVLLPKMYDRALQRIEEVLQKGNEVWSYNALVQDDYSPKWAIDFAPINYRIQPGFMSQSLHLTGLLYWQVDRWTGDPWSNVQTYSTEGYEFPGEGMLVYPGQQVGLTGVVPSMRLKWLRDGVEDYEYMEILKRYGCAEFAMKAARNVAASWSQWTQDPALLESERRQLGAYVERVNRAGGGCLASP